MDRPSKPWDPGALTQPIPVVPLPPPRPTVAASAAPAQEPPEARTRPVSPAYVHRFGRIPFYLFARFAAFVIDIAGIGFVVATFGYHATDAGYLALAGQDASGFATLASISFGVALLLAFWCESIFGTTLGKLLFALHVRRGDGRAAGTLRVFARYLLRPIDLLAIGPLLALVTPRHQRIGDFLAGTVVARSRIGLFATFLAMLALVGIGYAQLTYGGGITSAIGVSAETSDFAPGLVARLTRRFGVPALAPVRTIAPQTQPSDAQASPAPIASGRVQ